MPKSCRSRRSRRGSRGCAPRWRRRLDAFVLYTNLVRPSAVAWLTGFTPYWSDALLLVAATARPILATALSKRVADWIRTTDPVERDRQHAEARHADRRAARGDPLIRRVGVLELDALPAGLADDIAAAAPAVEWIDGSALFAGLRRQIDDAERKLIERADALAVAALR